MVRINLPTPLPVIRLMVHPVRRYMAYKNNANKHTIREPIAKRLGPTGAEQRCPHPCAHTENEEDDRVSVSTRSSIGHGLVHLEPRRAIKTGQESRHRDDGDPGHSELIPDPWPRGRCVHGHLQDQVCARPAWVVVQAQRADVGQSVCGRAPCVPVFLSLGGGGVGE